MPTTIGRPAALQSTDLSSSCGVVATGLNPSSANEYETKSTALVYLFRRRSNVDLVLALDVPDRINFR